MGRRAGRAEVTGAVQVARAALHLPLRGLATLISRSPLCARGRRLWQQNEAEWNLPLSKLDKLQTGVFVILRDYGTGEFPPTFEDQARAYENERAFRFALPGVTVDAFRDAEMRKPFWRGGGARRYIEGYLTLAEALERVGVHPPARALELGSGGGWLAEFMAVHGYDVTGTTISEEDIRDAHRRIDALGARGLPGRLRFLASPMEEVDGAVGALAPFDVVFMFEALHHAFDYRRALSAAYRALRPGGWVMILGEPNVMHTFIAYRGARLTHTHEIGFSRRGLRLALRHAGFGTMRVLKNRWHAWVRPHWIAAQRPTQP